MPTASLAHKALLGLVVGGIVVTGSVLGLQTFGAAAVSGPSGSATVAGSSSSAASSGNNGNGGNPPSKNFTIAGTVTGLAPGVTVNLVPVITNPNNQGIIVNTLGATLQTSVCSDKISVGSWVGSAFTVPKNADTSALTPPVNTGYFPVTMDTSATNTCQDRTFTLSFTGSAGQA